jgi:glucose/arabinose dehydrogenase
VPRSLLICGSAALAALLLACAGAQEEQAGLPFRPSVPIATTLPVGYRIEAVLDGLELPTGLAATPDGRLLITEQESGRVRVVQDGVLLDEPWFELPVSFYERGFFQELGLVNIAADPEFEDNGFVYIYFSEEDIEGPKTVFARLRDDDGRGAELTRLFTMPRIPEYQHIGGGIAFDAAGAIFVGTGDHEVSELAQDLESLAGKILRVDRDGNAPEGNPFVGQDGIDARIYAYGMRNPFGLAVDRESGRAYVTSNRDTAGDAVYELEAGADYGWPNHLVLREPLVIYDQPMGLAGITVYNGSVLEELAGGVFYCAFHAGGGLYWLDPGELEGLDISRQNRRLAPGCTTGVEQGADGFLYFLSFSDGKLLRISRDI